MDIIETSDQDVVIRRMQKTAAAWSVVLFILILALASLLIFSIKSYEQLQTKLSIRFPVNQVWNSAQLELDIGRFLVMLVQYGNNKTNDDYAKLIETFDLLWSRVSNYKTGKLASALMDEFASKETINNLMALLEAVDLILPGLRSGDATKSTDIYERFVPFIDQVRQMTIRDLRNNLQQQDDQRQLYENVTQHVLIVVALFLITAVLVVAGALRSTWQLHSLLRLTAVARADAESSRAQLHQAIESISEGFAFYDAQDKLVLCNERYHGFYPGQAKPIRPRTIPADSDRGAYRAGPMEEHLADGRWVLVSDRTTEDGSFVSVRTDISELKWREIELTEATTRLEQQAMEMRRLAEVAEKASQTKSEFLAAMSHEIRTPLTGVLGMADLLASEMLSPAQKRYVDTIRTSGRHLLSIINDILDFSRIEAGQLELEQIDFELADVLEQIRSIMAPQAAERGLELRFEQVAEASLILHGDPTRLKQVLINLIGNGLKFTVQGSVVLRVRQMAVTKRGPRLRFEVRDTGIGIPLERQAELFQAFVQADSSIARHYGGSGLGLVICQRLVSAMDGEIRLESKPGQGSLFWFELAFKLGDAVVAAQRTTFEPAPIRPLRVLVVDDVAVNRELLSAMLVSQNHEVLLAADGLAALELAANERLDVVLMDVQMPVMDGLEATRRIRLLPTPLGAVPILALTANVMATERQRFLAAGMNLCLTKPVVWPELFAAIAKAVAGSMPLAGAELQDTTTAVMSDASKRQKPLLNRSIIDQISGAMPQTVYQKLLAQVLEEATESYLLLATALGNQDRLRREAHRLRGTAGTFGLTGISEFAKLIEDAASRDEEVADLVVELGRTLKLTRIEVQQLDLAA